MSGLVPPPRPPVTSRTPTSTRFKDFIPVIQSRTLAPGAPNLPGTRALSGGQGEKEAEGGRGRRDERELTGLMRELRQVLERGIKSESDLFLQLFLHVKSGQELINKEKYLSSRCCSFRRHI